MSASVSPHSYASSTSARARATCTFVRAGTTVPPLWNSQSMPSAAATRPTSSTHARIAAVIAFARSREDPLSEASRVRDTGKRPETHPPLRPDAPKPATSLSSTAIRSEGSRSVR